MNAQQTFSTKSRAARMADAASAYAKRLERDPTELSRCTQYAELAAIEAALLVWPEADSLHELAANIRHDLGIDDEGNALDENGFPLRTFDPSRVHPDDPCQSKGCAA